LPSEVVGREICCIDNEVGKLPNALQRIPLLSDGAFDTDFAKGMRSSCDRVPPEKGLRRRLDKDQTKTTVLVFEAAENLGKSLCHPPRTHIEYHDQPIHFFFRTDKKVRHQLERNIVDTEVSDILETAAQNRFSGARKPGDHEWTAV
jgi:hypothetical protein